MVPQSAGQNNSLNGIELQDINKSFGKLEVLSNLSLGISQGELFCLLGPSGCGKTTALKIINGLLEADSGRVYLNGGRYRRPRSEAQPGHGLSELRPLPPDGRL
jgi:ABC-type Fe3+/spermidine/putrescine transport system ATPase subunit